MSYALNPSQASRLPELRARLLERSHGPSPKIANLLSRREQIEFAKIATVLDYGRAGSTVFAEGEDAHFVYAVASGVVRIGRHSESGRRQILALMLPGDLFGLPDGGIYVNSAEVTCPTTLYRVPWAKLRKLLERHPSLQHNILNKVAFDLRESQRRIMVLGQQNTHQRLASLLVDFAEHPAFHESGRGDRVNLPLSRFDIADYLGTSAETVTRGFLKLEREGLIRRVEPRQIRILDLEGLRHLRSEKRRLDL